MRADPTGWQERWDVYKQFWNITAEVDNASGHVRMVQTKPDKKHVFVEMPTSKMQDFQYEAFSGKYNGLEARSAIKVECELAKEPETVVESKQIEEDKK